MLLEQGLGVLESGGSGSAFQRCSSQIGPVAIPLRASTLISEMGLKTPTSAGLWEG